MLHARDCLSEDDEVLLRSCTLEHMYGSGPGGQKRNKTSSAVRLTHRLTGISVRAEEFRSQKSNRRAAIERLRMEIAFQIRATPAPTPIARLAARKAVDVARFLDILTHHGGSLSDAADDLSATTGQMSRFICSNDQLLDRVNRLRLENGLKRLRPRAD